jgi:hypothetical protein
MPRIRVSFREGESATFEHKPRPTIEALPPQYEFGFFLITDQRGKVVFATEVTRVEDRQEKEPLDGTWRLCLDEQWAWSKRTFGEGRRTKGNAEHIRKELDEIEAAPGDLSEWVDVIMLAIDGYFRHGGQPATLLPDFLTKQAENFGRTWPAPKSEDTPVEHQRPYLVETGVSQISEPPLVWEYHGWERRDYPTILSGWIVRYQRGSAEISASRDAVHIDGVRFFAAPLTVFSIIDRARRQHEHLRKSSQNDPLPEIAEVEGPARSERPNL